MLRRLPIVLLLAAVLSWPHTVAAQQFYAYRHRSHATDCTALTDGKPHDLCYEVDSQRLFMCVPTTGDCSGAEWKDTLLSAPSAPAGAGNASALVDDIACAAGAGYMRNATDTGWVCGGDVKFNTLTLTPVDDATAAFVPATAGESLWYLGPNNNSTGSNDDNFEFRQSTAAGTDVRMWITPTGELNLPAAASHGGIIELCEDADGTITDCVALRVPDGLNLPTGTIYRDFNSSGQLPAAAIAGSYTVTANKTANYTLGTDNAGELYGGVIYVTAASPTTITVPLIQPGMSFTVITLGSAAAVSIDPNNADTITLDGLALSAGDKITNTSTAGDMAVCTYMSPNAMYCATGSNDGDPWTDTN